VVVTGRVPSVVEYWHRATVCVVPMRIGFGIKNKTLEAIAAGVPVVASDRGLEGLAIDQPQRALRATLAQGGRKLIEVTFTWERGGKPTRRCSRPRGPDRRWVVPTGVW
jgi:hypothetical protein